MTTLLGYGSIEMEQMMKEREMAKDFPRKPIHCEMCLKPAYGPANGCMGIHFG